MIWIRTEQAILLESPVAIDVDFTPREARPREEWVAATATTTSHRDPRWYLEATLANASSVTLAVLEATLANASSVTLAVCSSGLEAGLVLDAIVDAVDAAADCGPGDIRSEIEEARRVAEVQRTLLDNEARERVFGGIPGAPPWEEKP